MPYAAALSLALGAHPAQLRAWSDCAAEAMAYDAAKASFAADVEATYHVALPAIQFAPAGARDDLLAEKPVVGEVDLSDLANASRQARAVTAELTQMANALAEDANRIFLKRREMPQAFARGADLSRCLSALERAELDRIAAIFAARQAEDRARMAECVAAKASGVDAARDEAELAAKIAGQDQSAAPTAQGGTGPATALLLAVPELETLENALACMADSDFTAEAMGTGFGLAMTVNVSMRDRQALQQQLQLVFGRQMDFGYFDMNEGTE